jgi:hypothetical protein
VTKVQWETLRKKYPGKRRFVTTEDGRAFEWPWKSPEIPEKTRLWTIEGSGLPWVRLDNDDLNLILGKEWHKEQERKKKHVRRGNKKATTEPRKL